MLTRLLRGLGVVAALLGATLVPVTLHAAPRAGAAPVVWKSPVDPTIYALDDRGYCTALQYADWVGIGAPAPQVFPTEYLSVPGSSFVYASVTMCHRVQETYLSYDRWTAVGSPSPRLTWFVQEIQYLHYATTSDEIFAQPYGAPFVGPALHLDFPSWLAAGSPAPLTWTSAFTRLTWSPRIFRRSTDIPSSVQQQLMFTEWVRFGAPTPVVVAGFPGGVFRRSAGSDVIRYTDGSTVGFDITYSEWAAAGYPRPV